MTNEEAVNIISKYNPSLEYVNACDKIKQMEIENKILKNVIKQWSAFMGDTIKIIKELEDKLE